MKYFGLLIFLCGFLLSAVAQTRTECISNSRDLETDRIENLEGQYGLLLLSKHKNLVINVVNASKEVDTKRLTTTNADGFYEYRVILDKEDTHQVKVEVNRMGDVYKTEFVANLKPDFMVAYRIEEIMRPIRMEEQGKGNEVYMDATAAEVEFTTNIENLQIKCEDDLQAEIKRYKNPNDQNVTIVSVVFPIKTLMSVKEKYQTLIKELELLEEKINKDQATDDDWDRHDKLRLDCDQAEMELKKLSSLEIFSDNTNKLAVDISDMGPRKKKCFAVLPLVIEKEIYKTECSRCMTEGTRLFNQRKYADAQKAYISAISTNEDVVAKMKPIVEKYIAECDSCILYEKRAAFCINKILEMRKKGNGTQEAVSKYASAGIGYLEIVNDYNPNSFYTSRIESLNELLKDMPLRIAFTTVEWRTITEGDALPDVEIWAYYGSDAIPPIALTSIKKFKKFLGKKSDKFKQVGLTDAQGRGLVELDRTQLPLGFVFCPNNTEDIKMIYLSLNDLTRQAQGTYLEKQFRLKMYKRTNKYF